MTEQNLTNRSFSNRDATAKDDTGYYIHQMAYRLQIIMAGGTTMRRLLMLLVLGSVVSVIGLYLNIQAGAFASYSYAVGSGSWFGPTDAALRQSYREIGLVCLWLGASLLAAVAWSWTILSHDLSGRSEIDGFLFREPRRSTARGGRSSSR